jgi:hypothetical protein
MLPVSNEVPFEVLLATDNVRVEKLHATEEMDVKMLPAINDVGLEMLLGTDNFRICVEQLPGIYKVGVEKLPGTGKVGVEQFPGTDCVEKLPAMYVVDVNFLPVTHDVCGNDEIEDENVAADNACVGNLLSLMLTR